TLGGNMQSIARLLPMCVVVAVALVLGSPRPTGAASMHPSTANVRAVQPLLALDRRTFARTGPSAHAAPLRLLSARTALTRSPTVLPVIREATGPAGALWLRVRLPTRPNGSTGWVRASVGSITSTKWQIDVHRAQRRAFVLGDGKVRASFRVVVG